MTNNFLRPLGLAALAYIAVLSFLGLVLVYINPSGQWAEDHALLLVLFGPMAAMLTHSSIFGVVFFSILAFPFWVGVLADPERREAWIAFGLGAWLMVGGFVARTVG